MKNENKIIDICPICLNKCDKKKGLMDAIIFIATNVLLNGWKWAINAQCVGEISQES